MKKTSQQFILGDFLGYTQQIPTISFFLGWLSRDPIPIFPMVLSYSILSAHLRWWCPPTRSKELHNSKLHGAGSNKTIRGWGKDGAFYGILWDSMGMNWKIINSSQTKWIQFLYLKQKINFFFWSPHFVEGSSLYTTVRGVRCKAQLPRGSFIRWARETPQVDEDYQPPIGMTTGWVMTRSLGVFESPSRGETTST